MSAMIPSARDRLVFCFERGLGALHLAAIAISVGLAVVAFVASAVVLLLGVRFIEYAVGECVAKRCDLRLVTADREFRALHFQREARALGAFREPKAFF